MSYAVVQFIEDGVFSHVPISWLNASQTECLWPPNNPKNVTQLIKRQTAPGKHWCAHKIIVEGIYDSLETAIRKAGDAEYTSNDEEKGRGKRKKKFRQPSTSPSTDDREDSISPPPKLDIEQAEILWEQPCEELSEALNLDVDINSVVTPFAKGEDVISEDYLVGTTFKAAGLLGPLKNLMFRERKVNSVK
ncbi:uncharacterized protein LOC123316812 [Coccinella septempunctata]|uniref:uncharacterized protein LOC123316812 n=1 Tax=Coccinella septempunctata TaxID=41139 RepID=UPI001D0926A7|nr:uncharacterized protein LOC123316812 [Coccinella septempunctata]